MYIGPWQEYKLSSMIRRIQSNVKQNGISSIIRESKETTVRETTNSEFKPKRIKVKRSVPKRSRKLQSVSVVRRHNRKLETVDMIRKNRMEHLRKQYGFPQTNSPPAISPPVKASPEKSGFSPSRSPPFLRPHAHFPSRYDINKNSVLLAPLTPSSSTRKERSCADGFPPVEPIVNQDPQASKSVSTKITLPSIISPSHSMETKARISSRAEIDSGETDSLLDGSSDWEREVDDLVDWSKTLPDITL
ncbi:hypothetical protein AAMO2058_000189800 [Amorphochlora amoebiformis]